MTEMVAEHTLRFIENYCKSSTMCIARCTFVLPAQLKAEYNFALVLVKSRRDMERIIIQRTTRKTVIVVQLLANLAGLSLRIGLQGLLFV